MLNERERTDTFSKLKKLYDLRSTVAHSGGLKDKDIEYAQKHIDEFEDIAERVCKAIIVDGRPNWDKLILAPN